MDINHLSVSRGQCFEECQQKYKYRYHLRVIPDKPEQIHFTYGKLLHKAAELYVQNEGKTDIVELGKDLLYGKISFSESFKLRNLNDSYRSKFWEHIKIVKAFTNKVGFEGEIEHEITYDVDPPNNKILTGFIDRLFFKDGKAFILDYKTNKKSSFRKDRSSIKTDLQLSTYALYVSEKYNIDPENITAALIYVDGGNIVSTNFTKEGLENTKKYLKDLYYKIENSDETKVAGKVGRHCGFCDYNNICPFYKAESNAK
jgi:CRISPR/Cas system-associated exonuclease Cas4 (RecB family)